MERKEITGLSIDNKILKIVVSDIDNYKLFITSIYQELANKNIKFSLLLFESNKLSFVIAQDDLLDIKQSFEILNSVKFNYDVLDNLENITLVGLGFTSSPSLTIEVLNLLAINNIEINQGTASNLSYSLLIKKSDVDKALKLLANKYEI